MLVKYVGHDKLIMADFNGKRVCFNKNEPKEIAPELFNHVIQSGLIDARDFQLVEKSVVVNEPKKVEKTETHQFKKGKK